MRTVPAAPTRASARPPVDAHERRRRPGVVPPTSAPRRPYAAAVTDRRSELLDATITVIARRGVRGLRVQEVAAEAGVSVPLIYHYYGNREGLLAAALAAVNDRADRYSTEAAHPAATPREELTARLLGELQDTPEVHTTSSAWGELRWASVFDDTLRPDVARLTAEWVDHIAALVEQVQDHEKTSDPDGRRPHETAEILVALVEGLSGRWLTGAIDVPHLRHLLELAVTRELPPPPAPRRADARRRTTKHPEPPRSSAR